MAASRDLANLGDTLNGVSNVNIDSGTLFVDAINNRVGIGTTTPFFPLSLVSAPGAVQMAWSDATNGTARLDTASGLSRIWTNVGLGFGTGGETYNERMKIDSAGRITTPNQPAFHVYHSSVSILNISGAASGDEVFNAIAVNIGSGYSTGTGRYTAPVAGTYLFYGSIAYNAITTGSYTGSVIRKNGSMITEGYSTAATMGYSHPMVMVIATMAVNDYVTLGYNYSVGSGTIERSAPGRMFFGGLLLG